MVLHCEDVALGAMPLRAVIETVRAHSEDLAQKIIDEMFLFENLLDVDDRGIQLLLKEINTNALMVALKGSDEKLKEKFLRNMSTRAATLLRADMEARGPSGSLKHI